jgi:hypothetical protein
MYKKILSVFLAVAISLSLVPSFSLTAEAVDTGITYTLSVEGVGKTLTEGGFSISAQTSGTGGSFLFDTGANAIQKIDIGRVDGEAITVDYLIANVQKITINDDTEFVLSGWNGTASYPTGYTTADAFGVSFTVTSNILRIQVPKAQVVRVNKNIAVKFYFGDSESGYEVTIADSIENGGATAQKTADGDFILTATPNTGYVLDYWTKDSSEAHFHVGEATFTETLTEDTTYTAHFRPTAITASALEASLYEFTSPNYWTSSNTDVWYSNNYALITQGIGSSGGGYTTSNAPAGVGNRAYLALPIFLFDGSMPTPSNVSYELYFGDSSTTSLTGSFVLPGVAVNLDFYLGFYIKSMPNVSSVKLVAKVNDAAGVQQTITRTYAVSPIVPSTEIANPITVTLSVEALTIPNSGTSVPGYKVEPVQVTVAEGDSVSQVLLRYITATGGSVANFMNYVGGLTGTNFYLSAFKYASDPSGDQWLSEGEVGAKSGWLFSVNNSYPQISAGEQIVNDGDVIRWQYTCAETDNQIGVDLGAPGGANGGSAAVDKTLLLKRYAEIKASIEESATYEYTLPSALNVLKSLTATQQQVNSVLASLGTSAAPVNTGTLSNTITSANALKSAATAGNAKGQYPQTAYDAFATAIDNATAVKNNASATQEAVDNAVTALNAAIQVFADAKITFVADDTASVRTSALNWVTANVPNPAVASVGGEWAVIALARNGDIPTGIKEAYLANLRAKLNSKAKGAVQIQADKPTENERVVLALTSLGIDASNFEDWDLVSPLLDTAWVSTQGLNSTLFALIALDSAPYFPENTTVRDSLVGTILAAQDSGTSSAGWNGNNPDYTAFALQALKRYNTDYSAEINKGVAALKNAYETSGKLTYGGDESLESYAQVIIALSGLGIDAETIVYNGTSLLGTFLRFAGTDGRFQHTLTGSGNAMATEQAAYALVAYNRYKNGQSSLFDMSDKNITQSGATDTITSSTGAVTEQEITAALAAATNSGSNAVTIDANASTVTIPASGTNAIADASGAKLTVKTGAAEITFDNAALDAVKAANTDNGSVTISAQSAAISASLPNVSFAASGIDLTLTAGANALHTFSGGTATVTILYLLPDGTTASQVVVYYIPDSGTPERVKDAVYSDGFITFTASHFSIYAPGTSEAAQITVGDVSGKPGSTVTVPVSITNNPGFWGYSLAIDVPTGLTLTGLAKGTLGGDGASFLDNVSGKQATLYYTIPPESNITGDGVLFYATFQITGDAGLGTNYTVSVDLVDDSAKNFAGFEENAVPLLITSGTVTAAKTAVNIGDINFTIPSNAVYSAGTTHPVNVTKAVEGIGDITVKYNGSTDAPINAGSYAVTAEIAANGDYAAATLELGTLVIAQQQLTFNYPTVSGEKTAGELLSTIALTPSSNDYGTFAWTNPSATVRNENYYYDVTFTPNAPYNDGNYTYTASQSVLISVGTKNTTWTVADLTITFPDNLIYNGSAKAVTVAGKSGMGAITVKYNDSTTAPKNAGTYTIKVEVAEGDAYGAKAFTLDQTLVIAKKQIAIAWPAFPDKVNKGVTLSTISFNSYTYGTFSWVTPTTIVNETRTFEAQFEPNGTYSEDNYDFGEKTHDILLTVKGDRQKGNGNDDDYIDMVDILDLADLVAGRTVELSEEDKTWLDMDDDGKFTIVDLLKLVKLYLGLDA